MKTIEVKHLMVPLDEYTTVNENATLHEAVLACILNHSVLIDGDRSNEEEDSPGLSLALGSKKVFLPSGLVKKYQNPVFRLCQASPVTCFPLSLIPACKIS